MATFNLRLKDEQDNKLKYIAQKQERSRNKQIEYILNQFITEYEKVNGKINLEELKDRQ